MSTFEDLTRQLGEQLGLKKDRDPMDALRVPGVYGLIQAMCSEITDARIEWSRNIQIGNREHVDTMVDIMDETERKTREQADEICNAKIDAIREKYGTELNKILEKEGW